MVKGLYTAYTGMLNQQHMLDTITNNLANSATTGYKKEGATARAFDDMFIIKVKDGSEDYVDKRIGKASLGVKIGENYTDYTQGNLKEDMTSRCSRSEKSSVQVIVPQFINPLWTL